jgi:hypothetical protein
VKPIDNTTVRSLISTAPNARELRVATLVAQSMIRELKSATEEWGVALAKLDAQKANLSAPGVN